MPVHQYEASLYATPPSGGVLFVFSLYPRVWGFESSLSSPTQVVRVAHSTRGYFMPPRHTARLLIWLA